MVRRKLLVGVALLAAVALLLAACGGEEEQAAKPTLKIAFMGDLTGPNKSLCIGPRNAVELEIQQRNASGDLPVTLSFAPQDTQGDKDKAVPIAQQLIADSSLVGVVGPCFSGESFSTGPILNSAQVPFVTPSATNPGLAKQGWSYWFRVVANDDVQSGATPDVLVKYVKATKIFIAHDKTAYGEGLATLVRDKLRASNPAAVAGFEAVDPGRQDYSALVNKVLASGADAFYWGAYQKEAGLIAKQLKEKGFTGKFVGADGSKGTDFLSVGGAAVEGAVITCPCLDPATSSESSAQKFVTDYKAKYGEDPPIYAAEGWDAALVIIEAIKKAGAPRSGEDIKDYRARVRDAIAATSGLKGLTRELAFESNGEPAGTPGLYLYSVEGGKFKLLGLAGELIS